MKTRNPFATSVEFLSAVRGSFEVSRGANQGEVKVSFSVGVGRGSARPELTGEEFVDLVSFLSGEAQTVSLGSLLENTPVNNAIKTLVISEKEVEFKVSNDKGARTLKIPLNKWNEFRGFLTEAVSVLPREKAILWGEK